jgi:UDP-N-acetylglucosamine acyltransferase
MKNIKIHPTALVDPQAEIGEGCDIGPYCVVGPKVKMGKNNKLVSHVVIENRVVLGDDNLIYPFSVIGGIPQDLKYKGEDTLLEIGSRNTIRECATLNIGTVQGGGVTKIGSDNLLMAYVHVAHDVVIMNHTILGNSCQIGGHVLIEDYATIGGLSAVAQFIRIGAHAYIGGASGLDRDVPPFTLGRGISSDYKVWGLNLVGLKRRGFSRETIQILQEVNEMFFQDKSLEKEECLKKIEEKFSNVPEVAYFVSFVRSTQKGIYR